MLFFVLVSLCGGNGRIWKMCLSKDTTDLSRAKNDIVLHLQWCNSKGEAIANLWNEGRSMALGGGGGRGGCDESSESVDKAP